MTFTDNTYAPYNYKGSTWGHSYYTRHGWCNETERMPPAGRSALASIVNRVNKIPARTGTIKEERGWFEGYSDPLDLGAASRGFMRGRGSQWGIPTTQLMRRITTCAANIMPFVPRRHPQDAASLWSAAGLLGQISDPWLLYCGLGSNLYCNIVGGREQKLILTEGNPDLVGNKLLLS